MSILLDMFRITSWRSSERGWPRTIVKRQQDVVDSDDVDVQVCKWCVLQFTVATHNNSHFFCNFTRAVFIHTKYTLCSLDLFFHHVILALFTADSYLDHLFCGNLGVLK
jgi:hypothetical protein